MSDRPNANDQEAQINPGHRPERGVPGGEDDATPAGLRVENDRVEGALIVRVSGALRYPGAVELTHAIEALLEHAVSDVTVLDLSDLTEIDHTGIAMLVAVGRDLKAAGSQVRVVSADRAFLGRLPYTLGLRRTFGSLHEALSFQE